MDVQLIQSDVKSAQALADIFTKRGDQVRKAFNSAEANELIQQQLPDLIVLDQHLGDDDLFALLQLLRSEHPHIPIIISSRFPDLARELDIKAYDVQYFLRAPFNKTGVEQLLRQLDRQQTNDHPDLAAVPAELPRVRLPIRWKIVLPYLLLALLLAMGAGYLISRVTLDAIEERFNNDLLESGKLTSAWLVEEENQRLETLRLLTFTDGLSTALMERDADTLRQLTLGLAINNQEEAVDLLDPQGISVLSLHHVPGGGREEYDASRGLRIFAETGFVQKVLAQKTDALGDKFAGLVELPSGTFFYVAGPVYSETGQLAGAVLVGRSLQTIVNETRGNLLGQQNTFTHVSIYALDGQPLASTYQSVGTHPINLQTATLIASYQDEKSFLRPLTIAEISYREILGPWKVRGQETAGLLGVSLAEHFLIRPSAVTQVQIFLIAVLGFILIILVGIYLARLITNPLQQVVHAAAKVSEGQWNVAVKPQGSDELTILAHTFNYMVSHLREGEIYRDLLGRTITPQVRDQLRRGLASGNLKLEGQKTTATVMITDIRRFTVIAENESPTTILGWLNQYYGEIVPIINTFDGVTNEFVGDSLMAFFGVLPRHLPPRESAWQACKAALEIIAALEAMNEQRLLRGEPPLITGIGINTGEVAAGGMGTADRLHYSVIGDTVNVSQRLEDLTREIGETSAIIGQATYTALGDRQDEFHFIPMGSYIFKGKSEAIMVYRLLPPEAEILDGKIDINIASYEELQTISGVGAVIARRIVAYRHEHQGFQSVDDLIAVRGIGPAKLARNRRLLTTNLKCK